MARIFTYIFASIAAGFLFSAHGWLAWHYRFYDLSPLALCLCAAPALLIALAAYLVRAARVATWLAACFAALLAVWSAVAARQAIDPEGVGIISLGFTPWLQLFVIIAFLLPLLIFACFHYHATRPNHALQRTQAGGRAGSEFLP